MKKVWIIILMILSLSGDRKYRDYYSDIFQKEKIISYVRSKNHRMEGYKHIIIISDQGCLGCYISFSKAMCGAIENKENLFIISIDKNRLSGSPFKISRPNIIINDMPGNDFLEKLMIISILNGKAVRAYSFPLKNDLSCAFEETELLFLEGKLKN